MTTTVNPSQGFLTKEQTHKIEEQERLERQAHGRKVAERFEKAEQKAVEERARKVKRMAAIVGCSPKDAEELLVLLRSIW